MSEVQATYDTYLLALHMGACYVFTAFMQRCTLRCLKKCPFFVYLPSAIKVFMFPNKFPEGSFSIGRIRAEFDMSPIVGCGLEKMEVIL